MVDTGAMVSVVQPGISKAQVQPCNVQARGVTGTELELTGEQEITFVILHEFGQKEFTHTFLVSPLMRCSSGILGMDFLHLEGAEISLAGRVLNIGLCSFPLSGRKQVSPTVWRLINAKLKELSNSSQEEEQNEPVKDWEGTVELAETVTVPPLSVRIARCRVIRRDDSTGVKVPQDVMVDPVCGLPGIYVARIVATMERSEPLLVKNDELFERRRFPPYVVDNIKSPLVYVPPHGSDAQVSGGRIGIAQSNGEGACVTKTNDQVVGRRLESGAGECQPELLGNGFQSATIRQGKDLQAPVDSHPIKNWNGIKFDTQCNNMTQANQGQVKFGKHVDTVVNSSNKTQVLGYVPIQIVNLSLEDMELKKHMYIGEASPIEVNDTQVSKDYEINHILREEDMSPLDFESYLREKLKHLEKRDRQLLEPVLRRYKHLFYGLGSRELGCTRQVEHSIETGDAKPIKKSPYRTPHALKLVVDEHIDDMLKRGIIKPSMSPWSSSIVLVQKKSRDNSIKYRFCIDYRSLNAVTKPDAYPIPNITDTLDSLGQSKVFSVLDMASGYFQISVKPEHREKTAFSCRRGHFEYNKMAFGLINAPATYQRCIDIILMGLKGIDCLVYLDDVICFSRTMEEHAKKLQLIFERLEQANFRIQPEKCVFATDTVEYLGHICTSEGIRPDPKKIRAIEEYSRPTTVKEIRAFLGLAGYYRRHVPNFAELAKPLTMLTKKDIPFIWTNEQQNAFDVLKQRLSTEPLLIYPDFAQPFIIACDASTKAIGAVLSQLRDGKERPIAYCSRQLNSAESKYSTTELELLALLFATKQFRVYIYGRKFTVYTDHRALRWLLNLQDPSSRLTRWAVKLSEYDFVVVHRPGTSMRHADALSRNINQIEHGLSLSREVIKEKQEEDKDCQRYRQQDKFWLDEDGLLYCQETKGQPRIVIPRELVETVLEYYHKLPFSAHQGVSRTMSFIKKKYWWETLRKDISDFIRECGECAKRKTGNRGIAPMGDALEANDFLDVVSLDIVGPLPITEKGNRYLLTFVDHFTRFCDAIPIARQDTETIAREFVTRIITQFGVPRKLLTDRGANFTSSLIKETCKLLKIQKLQTSSYNPRANGICEKMHKLLIDMLSHFVRKDAKNWDDYVAYAVMAYRAYPHCSTGYSPYYLVFGRDMRLPIEDDWKPHVTKRTVEEDDYEGHVKALADRLREANKAAGRQSKLSHETAKRYYDRQAKLEQFCKGDLVYIHDPTHKRGRAKKFSYQYKGPFEIEQKISPLVYRVRLTDGTSAVIHVNRLKKAYGQAPVDKAIPVAVKDKRNRNSSSSSSRKSKRLTFEKQENEGMENGNEETFSRLPVIEEELGNSSENENSSLTNQDKDPEWDPGSSRSLENLRDKDTDTNEEVGYQLRSRTVGKSQQGTEVVKVRSKGNSPPQIVDAHTNKLPDTGDSMLGHSYNLRSKLGFAKEKEQQSN
jgi:hypothetical protein